MPNAVVEVIRPATSKPIKDSANTNRVTDTFVPQLGLPMWLTLWGTWSGTIQVQRSTDGGTTWNNPTINQGQPWMRFTGNCDEVIDVPSDSAGIYRLNITITSGTVNFRLAQ